MSDPSYRIALSMLPASRVFGIILGLELKGAIRQTIGKRFYLS